MEAREEKFPFKEVIRNSFTNWTGLEDPEVLDALDQVLGKTYFEMRRLNTLTLSIIERYIAEGKYCGYRGGEKLDTKSIEFIRTVPEDMKEEIRSLINIAWESILRKQKSGVEKLAVALKKHLVENKEAK